jgi:hypothetical protein
MQNTVTECWSKFYDLVKARDGDRNELIDAFEKELDADPAFKPESVEKWVKFARGVAAAYDKQNVLEDSDEQYGHVKPFAG